MCWLSGLYHSPSHRHHHSHMQVIIPGLSRLPPPICVQATSLLLGTQKNGANVHNRHDQRGISLFDMIDAVTDE